MTTEPKLTDHDVEIWFDRGSFNRGREYYRNGNIQHATVQGFTLTGRCQGSTPAPYRTQVVLNESGIDSTICSCPLGGNCKHCVALLLTRIHDREEFSALEERVDVLTVWEKGDLITLINKMVERYPDLESLIELQRLSIDGQSKPIDPEVIARRIENAVPDYGDYYGHRGFAGEAAIYDILETGDQYAEAGDWANAVTIYQMVAQKICDDYESFYDEEGEIVALIGNAGEGLGTCLRNVTDATVRKQILRAMFDIWLWDTTMGGHGASDSIPGPLDEFCSPVEKTWVATWAREEMPAANENGSKDWQRRQFGSFLLMLEADTLDDEAFIEICRRTGRHAELLDRLLTLKRVNEAEGVAQNLSDYHLVSTVNLFVRHGHEQIAWSLVMNRAKQSKDRRLNQWLKERAKEKDDPSTALEIAQSIFWERPGEAEYREVRELAEKVGNWAEIHVQTVKKLTAQANFRSLTEVYLVSGDVDNALDSLQRLDAGGSGRFSVYGRARGLRSKVAAAATTNRPDAAVTIYVALAEEAIAGKSRRYYADAAQTLLQVRRIYHAQGQTGMWLEQIARLRSRYRNLPAMQDEFDKVDLER